MRKHALFGVRALIVGAAISAFAAGPAGAGTTVAVDTSWCTNPLLSRPFASAQDSAWYTLAPGQTPGNFNGTGWTLSGGAKLVTTVHPDGTTGTALDLPSGSRAVSPTICVTSAYPTARMMVRNAVGSEGVHFYVSYEGTKTWTTPKDTGQVHGTGTAWTLSDPVRVQPQATTGWQPVRFTLVPGGKTSEFQVYDLYVDPRCRA